jgi:hypothetical protein
MLGIPLQTFYSLVKSGTVTHYQELGRRRDRYAFSVDDVAAFLLSRTLVEEFGFGRQIAADATDEIVANGKFEKDGVMIKANMAQFKKQAQKFFAEARDPNDE